MQSLWVTLFCGILLLWGYLHFNFWLTFKHEAPEKYRQFAGFKFFRIGGFQWVGYCLTNGYQELENKKINTAGTLLRSAYIAFACLLVLIPLLTVLSFLVAAFI